VAVTFLGIVVYRQESDITEIMHGNRLVSLQSVTEKDGQHVEVHGEAQGDQFLVNATTGSFAGPATIAPSDPWVLKRTGEGTVVFTDTGRIIAVHISGGDYETISINGIPPDRKRHTALSRPLTSGDSAAPAVADPATRSTRCLSRAPLFSGKLRACVCC